MCVRLQGNSKISHGFWKSHISKSAIRGVQTCLYHQYVHCGTLMRTPLLATGHNYFHGLKITTGSWLMLWFSSTKNPELCSCISAYMYRWKLDGKKNWEEQWISYMSITRRHFCTAQQHWECYVTCDDNDVWKEFQKLTKFKVLPLAGNS